MPARYGAAFAALIPVCVLASASPAGAQSADATNATSPLASNLPRPGFEPRTLRLGATTIVSEIAIEARHDSNIFAVSRAPVDDVVLIASPRISADGRYGKLTAHGEIFADIREYLDNGSESRATFGVAASGNYLATRSDSFNAGFRAERFAESRNDPEANSQTFSPRLVNAVSANLGYDHEGSRFGIRLRGAIQHLDYIPPEDAERSLTSISTLLRASYIASPRMSLFVQPYANRRDHDRQLDSSGIDRDVTTLGAVAGVRLSITGNLSGEAGVGVFSANPDDVSLPAFSGFAANADLSWSPQPRTILTLRGFSGDAATVRAGAIGRTDQLISLRLDQEIRHNLLFAVTLGYQQINYRGLPNELRTVSAQGQGEYLVNRLVSIFVNASYARRRASPATDSFNRRYLGIGVRLRH